MSKHVRLLFFVLFLVSNSFPVRVRARRCTKTRVRKRAKQSRRLASALTIPKDVRGEPIEVHTAAYNGESETLAAYISQGGDLEVRQNVLLFSEAVA